MEFLKEVLGDSFASVSEKIERFNREHPDRAVKLADLSGGKYVSKAKYNDLEAEANRLKKQVADFTALRESGKTALNSEPSEHEKALSDLKDRYKRDTEALRAELERAKVDAAVDLALVKNGARNIKAARALIQFDGLALKDGLVDGLEEQIEQVRAENSFLFGRGAVSSAMKQGGGAPAADGFVVSARQAAGLARP